ncbi:MAG: hexokinase [Spirochaetaceae bacterium]|jgi:hexokinase|nr:hexokinase [Spirochaetaceae bacterium]
MNTGFNPYAIDDFARYYGFHYNYCPGNILIQDYCIAMDRGLKGEKAHSLPMIPTYLSPKKKSLAGKKVVALDAGGTNLRAARIKFDDNGGYVIESERKTFMPGTKGALTADEFFSDIAAFCEPLFDGSTIEGIGFCFSFFMEMTPEGDGIPLSFSKELELSDLIGHPLGKGLREALNRRGVKFSGHITMLNDTVATLLCGYSQIPARIPSKFASSGQNQSEKMEAEAGPAIGFILGTGFNIAYCETKIPKINFESKTEPQIVVCEPALLDFRHQGAIDREFDAETKQPGMAGIEKAMSGAYLGQLSLHILKHAVRDGILRFKKSAELLEMKHLETKDLNTLLQAPLALGGPLGKLFAPDEADALRSLVYIESIVTERAAVLAAASLAAVIKHCESAYDPLAPVRVAVEGTTFSMYHFLSEAMRARFHEYINVVSPRFCIIETVDQASLFGAATAAALS